MQSVGPYDPLGACALPLLISKMSIAALRAEVRKANTAYRNGEPIMSDKAYDQLLEQLRSKAPHAPELDGDATVLLSLLIQLLKDMVLFRFLVKISRQ